jgi:thiol-disulfide isomerase/thioredoxin
MSHDRRSTLFTPATILFVVALAMAAASAPFLMARQPGAVAEAPAAGPGVPKVPPVPEGTPEELMKFIADLKQANVRPASRQEMMAYMKDVALASRQVADKILAQSKPGDAFHAPAAMMKLESLLMLGRLGDEQAPAEMAAYAATLVNGPSAQLAAEAKRLLLVAEAQKVLSAGDVGGAKGLVEKTAALLAADPDDLQTAGLAMQLAGALEHMPGADDVATAAYRAFGAAFAKSGNEQIQRMGETFAGTLRRLSLPGQPMEITGKLLSGQAFDPKTLAGKVVLVDFWATWCGPCVAEIPNVLEQYRKYHDRGFEVVGISLDHDRETLEKFVADQKVPWPILFEEGENGGQHPLAAHYSITSIPTVILIGRDGRVITLNVRGEKLGEELDKLFGKAG